MSVTKTQQCHKSTCSINMLRNSTSSEIWEAKWRINIYNGCSNFCICRRVCVCVCVFLYSQAFSVTGDVGGDFCDLGWQLVADWQGLLGQDGLISSGFNIRLSVGRRGCCHLHHHNYQHYESHRRHRCSQSPTVQIVRFFDCSNILLSFVCVFLVCVYAHAGVPGESTQSVQLCAHRQVAESVRYWCASCRAVVNDGRVCGKSFMGVWGCRRSLLCVCVCVSEL